MVDEQRETMCKALYKDLHKNKVEALAMEVELGRNEIITYLNQLDDWIKPEKVKKNMVTMFDECYIQYEPFGVVLIMSAWNYPIQLILQVAVGAIAAGNCCILKPSDVAEHTAAMWKRIVPQYLDQECIKVVCGGVPETTALLKEKFDYILYTGNSSVAKIVMTAAAQHLTPVTLELGGKSPVYVDKNSDINLVARRVTWGRFTNCGQTCIAPDYVLCQRDVKNEFVERVKATLQEFYGEDPKQSESYGRIVNDRHLQRVKRLLQSGTIASGGKVDEKEKYISPTVLVDVKPTDPAMQEEIFGPVLPILDVSGPDEAIEFINNRDKPLALYVFSKDRSVCKKIVENTSSGGTTVNDCLMHASLDTLPFGGVGNSGMGAYHGKFTFELFSHKKACMFKKQAMESLNSLRYPPVSQKKIEWMSYLLSKKQKSRSRDILFPLVFLVGILAFFLKIFGLEVPKSVQSK